MTEAVWLHHTTGLAALVGRLDDRRGASRRKCALLVVAFCRRLWHLLADDRSRVGVEYTEALADDPEGTDRHWPRSYPRSAPENACYEAPDAPFGPLQAAAHLAYEVSGFLLWGAGDPERALELSELGRLTVAADRGGASGSPDQEVTAHCVLVRDIFGNPFRPVTVLPGWRTSTVLELAQQMYDSRDFSAMLILADALEDAGCADEAILAHCRGPGPHVRGCFCVDAILGKT